MYVRNNIINKVAETSLGCRVNVLRTYTLALVYSTVKYCTSIWSRSTQMKREIVELNSIMRTILSYV